MGITNGIILHINSFHIQECIYTDKKQEREAANKTGPKAYM